MPAGFLGKQRLLHLNKCIYIVCSFYSLAFLLTFSVYSSFILSSISPFFQPCFCVFIRVIHSKKYRPLNIPSTGSGSSLLSYK